MPKRSRLTAWPIKAKVASAMAASLSPKTKVKKKCFRGVHDFREIFETVLPWYI